MADSDFEPVTSEKERERVLAEVELKNIQILGLGANDRQFTFVILSNTGGKLKFQQQSGPRPNLGEKLELMFGLLDGRYLAHATVEQSIPDGLIATIDSKGADLLRLQRRLNFRASYSTAGGRFKFLLTNQGETVVAKKPLSPIDISAGGIRLTWAKDLPAPSTGQILKGVLQIENGREIELTGVVRTLYGKPTVDSIGMEFKNLSSRDEQALLFVCLQLRRSTKTLE